MAFFLAFSNNDSRYSGVISLSESERSESLSVLESDELESELDAWLSSIFVGSVDKDRTEYTMRSVKLPIALPFPLLLDGLAADIVERGIVVIVGPAI